jgi:hypothetical protein
MEIVTSADVSDALVAYVFRANDKTSRISA